MSSGNDQQVYDDGAAVAELLETVGIHISGEIAAVMKVLSNDQLAALAAACVQIVAIKEVAAVTAIQSDLPF